MKRKKTFLTDIDSKKSLGVVGKRTDLISVSGEVLNIGDLVELSYEVNGFLETEKTIVVEEHGEQFLLGLFEESNEKHEYLQWNPIIVKKFNKLKEEISIKIMGKNIEYRTES